MAIVKLENNEISVNVTYGLNKLDENASKEDIIKTINKIVECINNIVK